MTTKRQQEAENERKRKRTMNKLERAKIFRPQKGIEKYYEKGENESERGNFIRHPVLHILTYLASLLNFEHIVNSFIPLKSFYFLFSIFSLSIV